MEKKPPKNNKVVKILIEKPSTNNWAEVLTYLVRVTDPKEVPNYTILIGLASYACSYGDLTPKQTKIAEDIVRYALKKGVL